MAWYCFLFEQNQGFNCREFFFHYLLIDKSCSQGCETSCIVSGLPGFPSSSLRTRTYPILGAEHWWQGKASTSQLPHEQLFKQEELVREPAPSPDVAPQVMEPQLGAFAALPFHPGVRAKAGVTALLPRLALSCLDFEQTTGCRSLARAWLEAAAELEEGKVNFKSPSCTCVGTRSCARTDAASFVRVSHSYGSGL